MTAAAGNRSAVHRIQLRHPADGHKERVVPEDAEGTAMAGSLWRCKPRCSQQTKSTPNSARTAENGGAMMADLLSLCDEDKSSMVQ